MVYETLVIITTQRRTAADYMLKFAEMKFEMVVQLWVSRGSGIVEVHLRSIYR